MHFVGCVKKKNDKTYGTSWVAIIAYTISQFKAQPNMDYRMGPGGWWGQDQNYNQLVAVDSRQQPPEPLQ